MSVHLHKSRENCLCACWSTVDNASKQGGQDRLLVSCWLHADVQHAHFLRRERKADDELSHQAAPTCASNQQSADPMVLVGPVLLLHTLMPVEKLRPRLPKSMLKLVLAGTEKIKTGTAVSAGTLVVLCNWINCALVLEL